MKTFALVAALAVAAGLAWPAAAKPMTAFVKPGVTAESAAADYEGCYKGFSDPKALPAGLPPTAYPTVAAAAAAGAATGFMQGYMEMKQRLTYVDTCMASLGYSKIEMTAEETKGLKAARGKAAKDAWVKAFYARKGAELAAAAVPPAAAEPAAAETSDAPPGAVP